MIDEQALRRALAHAVRDACVRAATEECEDARIAGLCWEGAWEVAIDAIRSLPLETIIKRVEGNVAENRR